MATTWLWSKSAVVKTINLVAGCRPTFVSRRNRRLYGTATAVAEYPVCKPRRPPGRWGQMDEKLSWKEYEMDQCLRSLADVRERLEKLAGEKPITMWDLDPLHSSPGTLPSKQYITKTHIIQGLPEDYYHKVDVSGLENIKARVINAILQQEYHISGKTYSQDAEDSDEKLYLKSHKLIRAILDSIMPSLISKAPHLLEAQVDENVRVECFLRRQGYNGEYFEFPGRHKKTGCVYFQSKHVASWQIRTELPLTPFVGLEDNLCTGVYPSEVYPPPVLGFKKCEDRPISVSGHWIGDPCEWGILGVHVMDPTYYQFRSQYGLDLSLDELLAYGLIAGFTSTASQAHNQGFNTHHELTYPIIAQNVVTDGLHFRFFCYQLNTLHLWKPDDVNPHRNLLWVSPLFKLYDAIKDGAVHGFNDNVLSQLLTFMLNAPQDQGFELRPNLSDQPAPGSKRQFINHVGHPPLPQPTIGRFQYPRNAVYF